MNYYPFHLGDYAAHTAHLEPMEDLAYRRMLDLYYRTEAPLPTDWRDVARLIRMKDQGAAIESVLSEFFALTDEGWRHARCDGEIASFKAMAEGGRKGAAKRWGKGSDSPPIATPSQPQCQPEPKPEPNTSEAKASGGRPPVDNSEAKADPRRELYEAGKSLLSEQGMPKAQTGSFITKLAQDYGQDVALEAVRSAVSNRPLEAAAYLKATCQRLKGERKDPVTVPSTDTGAEQFKAAMEERAAAATRPPAEVLALARRAVRTG